MVTIPFMLQSIHTRAMPISEHVSMSRIALAMPKIKKRLWALWKTIRGPRWITSTAKREIEYGHYAWRVSNPPTDTTRHETIHDAPMGRVGMWQDNTVCICAREEAVYSVRSWRVQGVGRS